MLHIIKSFDYSALLDSIDNVWNQAQEKAVEAVNTGLLLANWETGRYIVEFEQKGQLRAEYGTNLLMRVRDNTSKIS